MVTWMKSWADGGTNNSEPALDEKTLDPYEEGFDSHIHQGPHPFIKGRSCIKPTRLTPTQAYMTKRR